MGSALCECLRGSTSKQSANTNLKEKGKTFLCVIFTYTPPFIFQIPPELLVELDVSCVTILSSVLIICWSQGGCGGDVGAGDDDQDGNSSLKDGTGDDVPATL